MNKSLRIILFSLLFSALFSSIAFARETWDASVKILAVPDHGYEGHLIEFWDDSAFHLGSAYDSSSFSSAETASEGGYIRTSWEGSFSTVNTIKKNSGNLLAFSALYDSPCTDTVSLKCTGSGGGFTGQIFSDSITMKIGKCPGLESVSFKGEQRAYRRQQINICLAQRPDHPVDRNTLLIEILDSEGQAVSFCREVSVSEDENPEFIYCSMEFLTKNSKSDYFTYHIYAEDDRGSELDCSGKFFVAEDKAPSPLISMKQKFYRSQGGGPAVIYAEAGGNTNDDPAGCEWLLPQDAENFADTGGGTGKCICFTLANPGRYSLGLKYTDIPEDTLPEFVSDDERRSAVHSVNFKVDNIAPVLGIMKTKSLELLLINSEADTDELASDLLDMGIVADIYPVSLDTAAEPGLFSQTGRISGSYSKDLDNNFFYNSAFSCDDRYLFRVVPTLVSRYPSPPYSIYRYSLSDLSESPVIFTVSDAYLSRHSAAAGCSLGSDLQQKYLYLSIGGNSVVLDKENGTVYGPFENFVFGKTNIIAGGFIYSLLEDGVYKISLSDMSICKALSCSCILNDELSARLFRGNAVFAAKENGMIYKYTLSLNTGTFSREEISESEYDDRLIAITPSGRILINSKVSGTQSLIRGWNRNLEELFEPLSISVCSGYGNLSGVYAVYDSAGEVNFVYTASASGNDAAATVSLFGLYSGYEETSSVNTKTCFTRNVIAAEFEDGTVLVGLGADAVQNRVTSYFSRHEFLTRSESEGISTVLDSQLEYGFRYNDRIIAAKASGSSAYCYVYEFSEGYPDNLARISLATLPGKAEYLLATEIADADYIAEYCGGAASSPVFEYIPPHYKTGETVRLSDFSICASDYENDAPFTEHSSMNFPASFDEPGEYSFDYWVTDNTGNPEFNYQSRKVHLSFFVDADENEEKENVPRSIFQGTHITYRLHRLF